MTKVVTGTYDEDGNCTLTAEAAKSFGEVDVDRVRREFELVMPLQDVLLLVHPLEHESVIDALRRHFQAAGMGTVTVATADGPRDVGVPLAFAGVKVFESTLIPAGEVRLAPAPNPSRALTVKP